LTKREAAAAARAAWRVKAAAEGAARAAAVAAERAARKKAEADAAAAAKLSNPPGRGRAASICTGMLAAYHAAQAAFASQEQREAQQRTKEGADAGVDASSGADANPGTAFISSPKASFGGGSSSFWTGLSSAGSSSSFVQSPRRRINSAESAHAVGSLADRTPSNAALATSPASSFSSLAQSPLAAAAARMLSYPSPPTPPPQPQLPSRLSRPNANANAAPTPQQSPAAAVGRYM
jgi:hypothetical protein